MALVNSTTPWRLCKSASAFFCLKLHCWPSSTLIHVLKQKEKFLINSLTWLNGCWSCDGGSSWCSCGWDAWWGCRGRGSGDRHWCRGHGCEQEPLDLAIGHGCLHELLTGPRNDRHPPEEWPAAGLWSDLAPGSQPSSPGSLPEERKSEIISILTLTNNLG